jgi:hypothetical protein
MERDGLRLELAGLVEVSGEMAMAKERQVGEFSFKFTSMTVTPGPAGSTLIACNYEEPVTGAGAGTVCGTATFVTGKSGTYSSCGVGFMETGEQLSTIGSGIAESSGKHRWHTRAVIQRSDGRTVITEGEIDLAERSWKGQVSETD